MQAIEHGAGRSEPDLKPAASKLALLVARTKERDLANPTPCEDWAVADLLTHIRGFAAASTAAARRKPFPKDEPALEAPLGSDWRVDLPDRLDRLADAWADPTAWDGDTEAAGIQTSAVVAGNAALQELLLHGWDLARATGQPFEPDPVSVTICLDFLSALSAEDRSYPFADRIEISRDATTLDQLLAISGRSPAWTAV